MGGGGQQSFSFAGGVQTGQREEGKIKADGTLRVRSLGQALVCTLFGAAPSSGRHGAARRGKASISCISRGTLVRNRRFQADRPWSADDENHFRPKPGRVRSDGGKAGQAKSFLSKVRKITRQQQAASGRSRLAKGGDPGYAAKGTRVFASGRGVQRGRGASFVRARNLSNGWSHRQPGSRRVIVKSRSVRGAGKSGKAATHLRYIKRDGTSRDGERGRLYSAADDRADGDAFLHRSKDDRHQFRFIISPEDAADLADLNGYTAS